MTFYEFDSGEYLRVWREMDDLDEEAVVIYHSHTATEAYPSRTDVSFAGWPEAHYLLVSTRDPDTHRDPLVPHRGRRGDRGAGAGGQCDGGLHGRAVLHVRAQPGDGRLRVSRLTPDPRPTSTTATEPAEGVDTMSIEVRIPTILRTYTDGQKVVAGAGDTIADLLGRPRRPATPASAPG